MTAKKAAKKSQAREHTQERWVKNVKTHSTHPPEGLFTKSRSLASRKVSPKEPVSGMRMLNYFINRAGKGLSPSCLAKVERAKELLSAKIKKQRTAQRRAA